MRCLSLSPAVPLFFFLDLGIIRCTAFWCFTPFRVLASRALSKQACRRVLVFLDDLDLWFLASYNTVVSST